MSDFWHGFRYGFALPAYIVRGVWRGVGLGVAEWRRDRGARYTNGGAA